MPVLGLGKNYKGSHTEQFDEDIEENDGCDAPGPDAPGPVQGPVRATILQGSPIYSLGQIGVTAQQVPHRPEIKMVPFTDLMDYMVDGNKEIHRKLDLILDILGMATIENSSLDSDEDPC